MVDARNLLILISILLFMPLAAYAQVFSSGSTGADGGLDLSTMSCAQSPNIVCKIQVPESGIFNFTTVNVPVGKGLQFKNNSRNTPVIILAQGNVMIAGAVQVSAPGIISPFPCQPGNLPGPGGFYGGGDVNQPGFGPGGGSVPGGNGTWVGPLSLVPIIGGSGAAGGPSVGIGGGGGGAIVIASSTSITMTSTSGIDAMGGRSNPCFNAGSIGSGGAIRLVANSLDIAGSFQACGFGGTNCGVVRLEAPTGSLNFTGSSSPAAVLSTINSIVVSAAPPTLSIVSVGGFAVPSYAGSRFNTVDLLLPNQLADPISVTVEALNIPVGTQVTVGFVLGSSQGTSTLGTLSGTFASSSANCAISGLSRNQVTYLLATAIFDPPAGAINFNPKGPDHVDKVRIESALGANSRVVFLRRNGTVIDQAKLPKKFLEQLGL